MKGVTICIGVVLLKCTLIEYTNRNSKSRNIILHNEVTNY